MPSLPIDIDILLWDPARSIPPSASDRSTQPGPVAAPFRLHQDPSSVGLATTVQGNGIRIDIIDPSRPSLVVKTPSDRRRPPPNTPPKKATSQGSIAGGS
jgi:hypothetical protein